MTWINTPSNLEEHYGFVYLITNLTNGRMYIGKKAFWKTKKLPPLKGRKNKRHSRVESDWKSYFGSSKELLKDKENGDEFLRVMVGYANSKSELSYKELEAQMGLDVLGSDLFYNGIIHIRLNRKV